MKPWYIVPVIGVFLIFFLPLCLAADTSVQIYRDGYVTVTETGTVDSDLGFAEVTLLSDDVENIFVLDQNGVPIYYEQVETSLFIYYFGDGQVISSYDTQALTSKNGMYWSFESYFEDKTTITLPQDSTILYINMMPLEIDLEQGSVVVEGGTVSVDYFFSADTSEDGKGLWGSMPYIVLALGVIAAAALFFYYKNGRGPKRPWTSDTSLDTLEIALLDHILDHGPVFESEIRERFDLPKTSSWRTMRRLQEQGYIKIEKKAKVNIISINKRA